MSKKVVSLKKNQKTNGAGAVSDKMRLIYQVADIHQSPISQVFNSETEAQGAARFLINAANVMQRAWAIAPIMSHVSPMEQSEPTTAKPQAKANGQVQNAGKPDGGVVEAPGQDGQAESPAPLTASKPRASRKADKTADH
jgi:hypothetical protein